ncbi:Conserved hypothetical protein [Candidatus Protochlamydia naegleriophila]|uniref:Haem-binding uptake Tiki superfamily ChaN domain-containing protein n=1 Tax=Candidatus Protochlamydia naegleriophila TaxID=389348 RepID=A0A0U5J976_9BACT|nr:hypothetical protein [Candidatus Protochlamydia naegleriophila]CUI15655.1 Conserved hypothetical protein [Candidatus Protochlamydia naegleriophila]
MGPVEKTYQSLTDPQLFQKEAKTKSYLKLSKDRSISHFLALTKPCFLERILAKIGIGDASLQKINCFFKSEEGQRQLAALLQHANFSENDKKKLLKNVQILQVKMQPKWGISKIFCIAEPFLIKEVSESKRASPVPGENALLAVNRSPSTTPLEIDIKNTDPSFVTKSEGAVIGQKLDQPVYRLGFFNPKVKMKIMQIVEVQRSQGNHINVFEEGGEIFVYHTRHEMHTWASICPDLDPYFSGYKSIFKGYTRYLMAASIVKQEGGEFGFWEEKLQDVDQEALSSPLCILPSFPTFTGSSEEISQLFEVLLKEHKGILVGENHDEKLSRKILMEHMAYLASLGIKTFFLEHCCFDTLQYELDQFFKTQVPSHFLRAFLSSGYGGSIGSSNYFNLIDAAVQAGIRPVGLEMAITQLVGYKSFEGSDGKARMLAMNMCAKEIIEREAGESKYMVLVGAGHLSYCDGVPGLSELCHVPSLFFRESEKKTSYTPDSVNLNMHLRKAQQVFNHAPNQVYRLNALIDIKEEV